MYNIVGVRYREGCKVYNFDAADIPLTVGDTVIVDSEQGTGVAFVVAEPRQEERPPSDKPLKKVLRKATDDDQRRIEKNHAMEHEAFKVCQQKILEREMIMKLVRVEWAFDNSKATFYFTADGRVDFRDLVKDLAHRFKIRIEMRQIGVRDEAKMIGGYGPCGRALCCSSFLKDFEPVSIRMAKKQDLVLNPAKISGICGRLMCCLGYEYSFYDEARKDRKKVREPAAGQPRPEREEKVTVAEEAVPSPASDEKAEKHKRKRNAWRKRRKKKSGGSGQGPGGPGGDGGGAPKPPEGG
jgi:cell fate regulator YaaT (PSP1 superfamily)